MSEVRMPIATTDHRASPFVLIGALLGIVLMLSAAAAVDTRDALVLLACGASLLLFSVFLPRVQPLKSPRLPAGVKITIAALALIAAIGAGFGMWAGRADRYAERGRELYRGQQYKEAAVMFGRAVSIDSKNPRLYNDLGWSYLYQRQCFPAREAFQAALRYEPGLSDSSRGLEIASRCAASFQQ